jgi:hypothetical protein
MKKDLTSDKIHSNLQGTSQVNYPLDHHEEKNKSDSRKLDKKSESQQALQSQLLPLEAKDSVFATQQALPNLNSAPVPEVQHSRNIKQRVTKMFSKKLSMTINSPTLNDLGNARGLLDKGANTFNITNLLPHKEALKDLKHVLHFSQFQNADSSTPIADGESFKILKHNMTSDKPSNIFLQVLDSHYDYKALVSSYQELAELPPTKASFNKFFTPLEDQHLETDYLVA